MVVLNEVQAFRKQANIYLKIYWLSKKGALYQVKLVDIVSKLIHDTMATNNYKIYALLKATELQAGQVVQASPIILSADRKLY